MSDDIFKTVKDLPKRHRETAEADGLKAVTKALLATPANLAMLAKIEADLERQAEQMRSDCEHLASGHAGHFAYWAFVIASLALILATVNFFI